MATIELDVVALVRQRIVSPVALAGEESSASDYFLRDRKQTFSQKALADKHSTKGLK